MEKVIRESGWRGKKSDLYWTKKLKYGVHYKCSFCGKETEGISYNQHSKKMHYSNCPYRLKIIEENTSDSPPKTS